MFSARGLKLLVDVLPLFFSLVVGANG